MENTKASQWKVRISLLLIALVICVSSIIGNFFSHTNTVNAVSFNDTTSYVSVGELFNSSTKKFNSTNVEILFKYITGNSDYTMTNTSAVNVLARNYTDAGDIRLVSLDGGTHNSVSYVSKSAGQDIVVKLGGLDWQVVYLSTDKSGNPILTLWLDNNVQEAWESKTLSGYTACRLYEGGLCSWFSEDFIGYVDIAPHMYGASYINAVTLNNGGKYVAEGTLKDASQDINNVFSLFTMEDFGLTQYLTTPRHIGWQENKTNDSYDVICANEFWSSDIPDEALSYIDSAYQYAASPYYDNWADCYLWLPSVYELSGLNGFWGLTEAQLQSHDGGNTYIEDGAYCTDYFTRSAYYRDYVYLHKASGASYYDTMVDLYCAVRPALHLDLSKVLAATVKVDELFNTESKTFNKDNCDILFNYIAGDSNATFADIERLSTTTFNAGDIREQSLASGTEGAVQYSAKSAGQDIVVRLGGLDWYVTCLSQSKSGDTILTLWLDNNVQEAWKSKTPSNYYFWDEIYNGGLFSQFAMEDMTYFDMYGTSYINAVTLNNGGKYYFTEETLKEATQDIDNVFSLFTMDDFGLTQYLTTPRNIGWQENKTNDSLEEIYVNDYWSSNITDDNFGIHCPWLYTSMPYYTAWADNYLWLPSYSELTSNMWNLSLAQLQSYDTKTSMIGNGKQTSYFTRSVLFHCSYYTHYDHEICAFYANGLEAEVGAVGVGMKYAVRPALHLNLSAFSKISIDNDKLTMETSSTYDGKEKDPKVYYDGVQLTKNVDYTVVYERWGTVIDSMVTAESYTVRIEGIGNYRGSKTFSYTINPYTLTDKNLQHNTTEFVYAGTGIVGQFDVVANGKTLRRGGDYMVELYVRNNSTGQEEMVSGFYDVNGEDYDYIVRVMGSSPNYAGFFTFNIDVVPRSINDESVYINVADQIYTGSAITPLPNEIHYNHYMVCGEDYIISSAVEYIDVTNEAQVIITGIGNFTGSREITYKIVPRDISDGLLTISAVTYTGSEVVPANTLIVGGITLVQGTDYTVSCTDNINVWESSSMTVTGIGNYTGTITKSFVIAPVPIYNTSMYSIEDSYVYTGQGITPFVQISFNDQILIYGDDYGCEYTDNIEVGEDTATITVLGFGNFCSSVTLTFSITPRDITDGVVQVYEDDPFFYPVYTGEPIELPTYFLIICSDGEWANMDYVNREFTCVYRKGSHTGPEVQYAQDVGNYYITITGMGNYVGTTTCVITVSKADLSNANIVLEYDEVVYTGEVINPSVSVKIGGKDLSTSDYRVTYENSINKGTYIVTVEGIGNVEGILQASYEIKPRNISGSNTIVDFSDGYEYIYSGSSITPEVIGVVVDGYNADFVVVGYRNNIGVGSGYVTINGQGNFTGSLERGFYINAAEISNSYSGSWFTVNGEASDNSIVVEYSQEAYSIAIDRSAIKNNLGTVISSEDYKIEYIRDGNITTDFTNAGTIEIVVSPKMNSITGTINTRGSLVGYLIIEPKLISNSSYYIEFGSYAQSEYCGYPIIPMFVIYYNFNGVKYELDRASFTFSEENNVNVGQATVTIVFDGNHKGTLTGTFTILPRNISNLTFTYNIPTLIYDGDEKTISWTVSDSIGGDLADQYTTTYSNNINAGTAKVTFTGKNNYTGIVEKTFTISPADIANMTVSEIPNQAYTGNEITPNVVVNIDSDIVLDSSNYDVVYSNNTLIGTANVSITGNGNYTGTLTATFDIVQVSISSATIEDIVSVTYNASEHKPKVSITYNGLTLRENTDYTLSYSNNVNAGTGIVTITGMTGFFDSVNKEFVINKADINLISIPLESEYVYENKQYNKLHENNIYFNEKLVAYSGDNQQVVVEYANNLNVGTATITITPYGDNSNFAGSKVVNFEITKAQLSFDMISLDNRSFVYTGSGIKPIMVVNFDGTTLDIEEVCVVVYPEDTINIGTKEVTLIAKEDSNFDGTVVVEYSITAKTIANVSIDDIASVVFNRTSQTPSVVVKDGTRTLTYNVDYTLEYKNNVNKGDAEVIVRGKGNYLNNTTATTYFRINPATIDNITLTYSASTYNRRSVIISASSVKAGSLEVFADEYKLVYYREGEETTDFTNKGVIEVKVLSNDNNFIVKQSGVSANYEISTAIITNITFSSTEVIYNTKEQMPILSRVSTANNLTLSSSEYSVKYYRNGVETSDFVNAGTIFVEVTSDSPNFCAAIESSCEYRILPKSINDDDVSIKYYFVTYNSQIRDYEMIDLNGDGKKDYMASDQIYIAYLVHPEIVFNAVNKEELNKGESFTFTILNNLDSSNVETATRFINVGEYVTTVRAQGNYTGEITDLFKVVPRDFTAENVTVSFKNNNNNFEYTGNKIILDLANTLRLAYTQDGQIYEIILEGTAEHETGIPSYRLYNQKTLTYKEIIDGVEEDVVITFEEGNYGYLGNTNVGIAQVFLEGVENFEGIICVEFNITPIAITDINNFNFELANVSNLIYTGKAIKPSLATHTYKTTELKEGVDYVVSYSNNINAGNNAKVIITGKNNYSGRFELPFEIKPKALEDNMLQSFDNVYFNGEEQIPDINLIYNTMTAVVGRDYSIGYNDGADFVNANDIIITITAINGGNYTGSITHTYKIMPRDLRSIVLNRASDIYDREAQSVTFVVRDMDNLVVEQLASNLTITYYNADDMSVINIASNPLVAAGRYLIYVQAVNNYTGSVNATYVISEAELGIEMMTAIPNQVYTMNEITPAVDVKYLSQSLVLNSEFTVEYSKNIKVGAAEVLVKGIGNYKGEFVGYFTIEQKNISDLAYDSSINLVVGYTGNVVVPDNSLYSGILKFGEYELILGSDFSVTTAPNSINVGEHSVQIKGIGNYSGTLNKVFNITPMDIANSNIVVSGVVDKTYTGVALTQNELVLTNVLANSNLQISTDYTISYENNVNVVWLNGDESASAKVIITAVDGGNYTGYREVNFIILAKNLTDNDITIASIEPVEYTGLAHQPKPLVKFGAIELTESDIAYTWDNNVDYGRGSVIITAKVNTNYKGSVTRYFEIGLTNLSDAEVSGIIAEVVYNGNEQKQLPTVVFGGQTLVLDQDYSVSYSSDTVNVGDVTLTISGIDNFSGMIAVTYKIIPLQLNTDSVVIEDIPAVVFTGSSITTSVEVSYNSTTLKLGDDYSVNYSNNINAGSEALVTIIFTGNYTGTATKNFVISAKEITTDMVVGLTSKTFTGSEIRPEFEIVYNNVNYLENNTSFDINYRENVSVGTAYIDIVGKNNFTGNITVSFEITAKTLTASDVEVVISETYVYTGVQITPEFSVKVNGTMLTVNNDYTYSNGTNINAGKGEIYIEFEGNYTGSIIVDFVIEKVDLSSDSIISQIDSHETYTGKTIVAEYSLSYLTNELDNSDYDVKYLRDNEETSDFVNVGAIVIRLTGKNNYKGTLDLTYNIEAKILSEEDVVVEIVSSDLSYTASEVCPEIVVKFGTKVLVEGTDYSVDYDNNISASTNAKVIITAIANSNYQGNKQVLFEITKRILLVNYVTNIATQSYTASAIEPELEIKYNGIELEKGVDYTVVFSNNTEVGTASVTITGIGNFDGTITKQFSITNASIATAIVSGVNESYVFTSNAIRPIFTVVLNGRVLEEGTDYHIDYPVDSINIGSKTIMITGMGNYYYFVAKNYTIVAKNIADDDIEVSGVVDKPYALGEAITHNFVVRYNGAVVYSADSYTYEYKNNINAGVATLTITGKGNYTGNKVMNFNITKLDSIATVMCVDAEIYEGSPINLSLSYSSTPGEVKTELTYYVAGLYTYKWTFIPTDSINYNGVTGEITLTAIDLEIEGLVFSGDYKKEYFAYDAFDNRNLVVSLLYNSGKTAVLASNKYTISISNGAILTVNAVIVVTYSANTSIKETLPITISQRKIGVVNNSGNLIANGEKQYLNILFTNANSLVPVQYEIDYYNLTNSTISKHIIEKGNYKAVIRITDNNYMLEENEIAFSVNAKTISSSDNNVSVESGEGFTVDESFSYDIGVDESVALQELGKTEFDVTGDFVSVYKFNLSTEQNITIKFTPNIENIKELEVYKLSNNTLIKIPYTNLGDGQISINCKSTDKLYLFRNINLDDSDDITSINNGDSEILVIVIIVLSSIICLTIFVGIIKRYRRNHRRPARASVVATHVEETQADNNAVQENNNTNQSQQNDLVSMQSTIQSVSNEELIRRYVIFDMDGRACGLRDGAPESLKNAFNSIFGNNNNDQQ